MYRWFAQNETPGTEPFWDVDAKTQNRSYLQGRRGEGWNGRIKSCTGMGTTLASAMTRVFLHSSILYWKLFALELLEW